MPQSAVRTGLTFIIILVALGALAYFIAVPLPPGYQPEAEGESAASAEAVDDDSGETAREEIVAARPEPTPQPERGAGKINGTMAAKAKRPNTGSVGKNQSLSTNADSGHIVFQDTARNPATERADNSLEDYEVRLGANSPLSRPGPVGEMRVWIGHETAEASMPEDWVSDKEPLSGFGQTAIITPYAPDFTVTPAKSDCINISPDGHTTRFSLEPKKSGKFEIGADVRLYNTSDCTGPTTAKPADNLEIEVIVNGPELIKEHLMQLWAVLWQGVLDFWQWLVAAVFGVAVLLIRKKLKSRFGVDPDAQDKDE